MRSRQTQRATLTATTQWTFAPYGPAHSSSLAFPLLLLLASRCQVHDMPRDAIDAIVQSADFRQPANRGCKYRTAHAGVEGGTDATERRSQGTQERFQDAQNPRGSEDLARPKIKSLSASPTTFAALLLACWVQAGRSARVVPAEGERVPYAYAR